MATSESYIQFVCEQLTGIGQIRFRKMFGEYMVYVNDKPIFLVCDNTVYVKKHSAVEELMRDAFRAPPYEGAKEHYILDIDDTVLCRRIAEILEPLTPLPKRKTKKDVSSS